MTSVRIELQCSVLAAMVLAVQAAIAAPTPFPLRVDDVTIENDVATCLTIVPRSLEVTHNVVLLLADVRPETSTAECGCKSALLRYSILEKADRVGGQPEYERAHGIVSTASFVSLEKPFAFVIAADNGIAPRRGLVLRLGCKRPD